MLLNPAICWVHGSELMLGYLHTDSRLIIGFRSLLNGCGDEVSLEFQDFLVRHGFRTAPQQTGASCLWHRKSRNESPQTNPRTGKAILSAARLHLRNKPQAIQSRSGSRFCLGYIGCIGQQTQRRPSGSEFWVQGVCYSSCESGKPKNLIELLQGGCS